jgi:SAM-dependent methyltransferase/uncharacterized protein YbaR (Trm112 family)
MKINFLYDFLVDPATGEDLLLNEITGTLESKYSGRKYQIVNSIPRILLNENQKLVSSVFHNDYGSDFKYMEHYQKDAHIFDYTEQNLSLATKDELARLRESILTEITSDHLIVLDVGCGNGWVSKKLIPLGKKVISMDISSVNPERAIEELPAKDHAGLIADGYNLPLKKDSIDCIIASEILEHVPDPKLFMARLITALKPGGKLILTVPYKEKIEHYLCVHCNKPTPKSAHLHSFDEKKFKELIPPDRVIWSCSKLINKYISRLRTYIFLRYLPFSVWIIIDRFFNRIINQPTRLKIVVKKIVE